MTGDNIVRGVEMVAAVYAMVISGEMVPSVRGQMTILRMAVVHSD